MGCCICGAWLTAGAGGVGHGRAIARVSSRCSCPAGSSCGGAIEGARPAGEGNDGGCSRGGAVDAARGGRSVRVWRTSGGFGSACVSCVVEGTVRVWTNGERLAGGRFDGAGFAAAIGSMRSPSEGTDGAGGRAVGVSGRGSRGAGNLARTDCAGGGTRAAAGRPGADGMSTVRSAGSRWPCGTMSIAGRAGRASARAAGGRASVRVGGSGAGPMRGGIGVGADIRGGIGVGAAIRGAGAAMRAAGALRNGAGAGAGFASGIGAGLAAGPGARAAFASAAARVGGGGVPRIVWAGMRRGGGGSWNSSGGACVRVASSSASIAGSDGNRGIGRSAGSPPTGFCAMRTDADGSEIGERSARGTGGTGLSPIGLICGRARGGGGRGRVGGRPSSLFDAISTQHSALCVATGRYARLHAGRRMPRRRMDCRNGPRRAHACLGWRDRREDDVWRDRRGEGGGGLGRKRGRGGRVTRPEPDHDEGRHEERRADDERDAGEWQPLSEQHGLERKRPRRREHEDPRTPVLGWNDHRERRPDRDLRRRRRIDR